MAVQAQKAEKTKQKEKYSCFFAVKGNMKIVIQKKLCYNNIFVLSVERLTQWTDCESASVPVSAVTERSVLSRQEKYHSRSHGSTPLMKLSQSQHSSCCWVVRKGKLNKQRDRKEKERECVLEI